MTTFFSSHVLEHLPNPIAVLHEWLRVLKPGGALLFVLPHPDRTFDAGRPLTQLAHLIDDAEKSVGYEDATHRPPDLDGMEWEKWVANGGVHYHVWTPTELIDLLRHLHCQIAFAAEEAADRFDSFVVVARRG